MLKINNLPLPHGAKYVATPSSKPSKGIALDCLALQFLRQVKAKVDLAIQQIVEMNEIEVGISLLVT